MLVFDIPNMSCGHCERAITEAVKGLDPRATVRADLDSKKVEVDTTADRQAVVARLTDAGYSPTAP